MFGTILKNLRLEKNITQKDLAKHLGVSDRSVGYYETGQRTPPPDILEKIADYFNVTVDFLLGRTEERNPYSEKNIEEEYKDEIEALEEFRQIMIDKGFDYEDKTYEELAEIIVKHIKIQELLNDSNSKSN